MRALHGGGAAGLSASGSDSDLSATGVPSLRIDVGRRAGVPPTGPSMRASGERGASDPGSPASPMSSCSSFAEDAAATLRDLRGMESAADGSPLESPVGSPSSPPPGPSGAHGAGGVVRTAPRGTIVGDIPPSAGSGATARGTRERRDAAGVGAAGAAAEAAAREAAEEAESARVAAEMRAEAQMRQVRVANLFASPSHLPLLPLNLLGSSSHPPPVSPRAVPGQSNRAPLCFRPQFASGFGANLTSRFGANLVSRFGAESAPRFGARLAAGFSAGFRRSRVPWGGYATGADGGGNGGGCCGSWRCLGRGCGSGGD